MSGRTGLPLHLGLPIVAVAALDRDVLAGRRLVRGVAPAVEDRARCTMPVDALVSGDFTKAISKIGAAAKAFHACS
jgi:hypothetical protein